MLNSADASCQVMEEEQLRGTSALWGHVLRLAARPPHLIPGGKHFYLSFYIKVDKPDVTACLNSMGSDL